MTDTHILSQWPELAGMPQDERSVRAAEIMATLAALPADARREPARTMLDAEAKSSTSEMATLIAARYVALTTIEHEDALSLAKLFEELERDEGAEAGMRRVIGVQTAAKTLTLEEVSRIEPFVPNIRQWAGLGAASEGAGAVEAKPIAAEAPKRRSLWKFFSKA